MQTTKLTRRLRVLLMVGTVAAATAGAIATPALADDDWHGHEGHEHAWRGDDDRGRGGPAYYYSYGYYGQPYYNYPYAYTPPPPVYAAPPAVGFYFGFH